MQTALAPEFKRSPDGREAEAILRTCVHCGFCTATCPTYQLLGDELDGPRGRIYLIKQVLEGRPPTRSTQLHLDRCLTCRGCESTCPSGVQYGNLVDIGRRIVDGRVARPMRERALRWLLKEAVTSPIFAPAMKLARLVRPLLPPALKDKVPQRAGPVDWPRRAHPRKVLMLAGCAQPALLPNIDRATARVLDAAGIQAVVAKGSGCCGALRTHLGDTAGGLHEMRRNIDAWWPSIDSGAVEAIVSNASGCGVMVKEYGHALAQDPRYSAKAARVSALTRDLSELLPELAAVLKPRVRPGALKRLAFHPPCTLQHGQRLRGGIEGHLAALGFDVQVARTEGHLCCGSAGTYSLLQGALADRLRERKLAQLTALEPHCVVSANVGCILHLQSGTTTPVRHWVEVLDGSMQPG
jgi:glycolate oxidase iron-sulfur subunit